MKYDLFISDFDGTLVRADGTVSKENRDAIHEYVKRGGLFAVCSGRMLPSILPRARELGLEGMVVAMQGSIVAEIETGKVLMCSAFEREDALRAAKMIEEMDLHLHVYTADKFYSNRDDVFLQFYERICRVTAERSKERLSELILSLGPIVKITTMMEPERRDDVYHALQEELGEGFYVTCSAECMVEILPAGQNKSRAIDFFCEHYHIPAEKAAAIGDALNDKEMLERAGGRFAVANAEQPLKEIATAVVSSNEENGVAEALIKYAMEEEL